MTEHICETCDLSSSKHFSTILYEDYTTYIAQIKGDYIKRKLHQMTKTFRKKKTAHEINFLHIVNIVKLMISNGYLTIIIGLLENY